jgi:uncharacterized membrane protein
VDRGRLEAFSDAVIAIVMTIMVLELVPPSGTDWQALRPLLSTFLLYVLSFIYLGIYWNNHHHLLKTVTRVNGALMWANLCMLFWLTLFPFSTAWMGRSGLAALPTAVYGVVAFAAGTSYYVLQQLIVRQQGGKDSPLGRALGRDWKGRVSPVLYGAAIILAWVNTDVSALLYAAVAGIWLVPDRRIERLLASETPPEETLERP